MATITILRFDELNPRKDRKTHSWLRLDNGIADSETLHELEADQKWFWICLLARASKKMVDTLDYNVSYFEKHFGLSGARMDDALRKLVAAGAVTVQGLESIIEIEAVTAATPSGNQSVTDRCPTLRTNITYEHYITNVTDTTAVAGATPAVTAQTAKAVGRGAVDQLNVNHVTERLLESVTHRIQESWLEAYPSAEWISQEVLKANTWMAANPKKAPKDFGRFMTNWLSKSFENYRKGIPSRRQTQSELNAQSLNDLYAKVQEEPA